MPAPPPSERKLAAQVAAEQSWANTTDRTARTAPGRAALDRKFLTEADGDPIRAKHLRSAYYRRLTLKSIRSRRIAAENTEAAAAAEAELASIGGDDHAA